MWIALGFRAHKSAMDSGVAADGRKWGRLNAGAAVLIGAFRKVIPAEEWQSNSGRQTHGFKK